MVVISCLPAFCSLQLWVEERLPLAQSADCGTNLQTVQLFMKKNQVSLISPAHLPLPGPAWPQGGWPSCDVQTAGDSRLLLLLAAFQSPDFIGRFNAERALMAAERLGIVLLRDLEPPDSTRLK